MKCLNFVTHTKNLGFETRGTEIANRLTAWHNLLEETRPSGRLTSNFYDKTVSRENVSTN